MGLIQTIAQSEIVAIGGNHLAWTVQRVESAVGGEIADAVAADVKLFGFNRARNDHRSAQERAGNDQLNVFQKVWDAVQSLSTLATTWKFDKMSLAVSW